MALDIVPITLAEANEFVKRNHRHHGKVIGHKFSIAVADVEGRLLVLPRKVGDVVYEILEETAPNHYFYISEHKVQDVSVKAVKYADEWEPYGYENLYFTREEAEAALERRRSENNEGM